MSDIRNEQRNFTRVQLDLPVEVHQGGDMWSQRLVDISLSGISTDQPDVWDAQYNEPFTLIVKLQDGNELELHAYLQHVEAGRLGFAVQHVDRENIEPLMNLLGQHMDLAALEEELARLE
ncbi:PilZ domain-containing protein [Pseudohalioglobus sediminis]|uniref:PilZ domain-containing protein n=1 Tax=Pseudohalioglobus sediminis TaxID=2606449 RepID=A0A5B0WSN5_9GAMM|nr:PilZ domain-containing protein [Pseudohalioglobus sediminis]KAA1188859.1 PilZ domain-containing protein [Pseudohalioglobus sediminis]